MQAVIDSAPHASRYFSDAFNTYRELCWWGEHASMYDKSETYSVEGDNAELRHYLARLTRRSRCFSKCIEALRRAALRIKFRRSDNARARLHRRGAAAECSPAFQGRER